LDDGECLMQMGAAGIGSGCSYTYRDLSVRLSYTEGAMRVEASSPTQALHAIRLLWDYPKEMGDSLLGDHWERTYGDMGFMPSPFDKKMPWYFIAYGSGPAGGQGSAGRHTGAGVQYAATCLGVKTGCHSIAYWQAGDGKMQLTMDTRNGAMGVLLGDRVLMAAEIVTTGTKGTENVFATGRRFCAMLCEKPRLSKLPVYGINDWYYAYGNNSPALILKQTSLITELATDGSNRPFSVVDAGWARYSPLLPGDCCWQDDYSRPNDKFGDMGLLAADIRKLGMRPALWTRPLCAAHDDPKNLLLPLIPGRDDPKNPVLDPSIEENIARVRRNIAIYRDWGYDMVKHDFTSFDIFGKWGFQMSEDITSGGWCFHDRSRTTAEIILHLYHSIRAAAGEMYLIGCNTMSHLSAGIFELNRVGDDTSGKEWARTRKMGVNTLGFRMIQHDLFYAADGDCVGLTKDVPWDKNKQWMELVAGSGTPLFISTQPNALGIEQKQSIRECFAMASRKLPPGEPLDWLTNTLPREWRLNGRIRSFDWG
jgi:alpha-galactosidase